jgi:hypothetical protein
MLQSYNLVNPFFSLRLRFLCRTRPRNHLITLTFSVSAEAEANYTKPAMQSARDYKKKILSYKSQSIGSQPRPCTIARFHHVVPGSTSCRMIFPSRPSSQ